MQSKPRYLLLVVLIFTVSQLWLAGSARATTYPQPPADSPFQLVGFIQAATLDNPADVLSGGTVTVNGTTVVIPRNTIVVMSATNLTWQELWAFAPCPWGLTAAQKPAGQILPVGACTSGGNGKTGLALSDSDSGGGKPLTTFEINILGNRVASGGADLYVAGLVYMAQQSLNIGQGIINYIDYARGELHVGGSVLGQVSAGDTRIQINDPVGRFGRIMSPDPRFTADTDNPTISSKTGYPMCIPRAAPPTAVTADKVPPPETDALCPQRNRPLDANGSSGAPLGNFTLCNPAWTAAHPGSCVANTPPPLLGVINASATLVPNSDSTQQAPFMVGDYIDYSGNLYQDADCFAATSPGTPTTACQYISAWQIVDNVGIFTAPGTVPAYLNIVLTVFGIGGTAITSPVPVPEEVTTRVRTRGFFTDPTRTVNVFATEVDPCTGAETDVLLLGGIPNDTGNIPWGRWRAVDQAGLFPVTKQWRVRYTPRSNDPAGPVIAANGLQVMQFQIPVAEYIFPENLIFGDPTLLAVPNNFQDFPFLVNGMGPWRTPTGPIVGQLTPFPLTNSIPGLTPPAPVGPTVSCLSNVKPPVVVINPANQTVVQRDTVTLNASGSTDPQGQTLSFTWAQQSGPTVILSPSANQATVMFVAPDVALNTANTKLTFQVTATNTSSLRSTSITEILVTRTQLPPDNVVITGATYKASRGVLNVTADTSDITCSAILTVQAFTNGAPTFGPATMIVSNLVLGGCEYTYVTGKTLFPAPTSIIVKSTLGGSATVQCPGTVCSIK
jgi:hypothetical protein